MNQIAQFDQTDINNAIAEFIPAEVRVAGKTATDKRLSVIHKADTSVLLYAAAMKGKVGAAAREGLTSEGFRGMTVKAARGNYTPLAQTLALQLGENVYLRNRAAYESYGDVLQAKMDQLEDAGKKWTASGDKYTSKYATLAQCLALYVAVQEGVKAIYAQRDEEARGVVAGE